MSYPSSKSVSMYKFLPIAVVLMLGVTSASAEELYYDIYGNVHVSLDTLDSQNNPEFNSNTSTFGIKGGRQLGESDSHVIFKLEWQVDITERNRDASFVDRDQWVGFKGNFGKILFGTATSNYKQTSSKVDPLWRTQLEGRGRLMRISSTRLAGGAGIDRGRLTNSVNYTTPKFGGFSVVANATFSGSDDESAGIGIRHTTKKSLFFVDYFGDGDVAGSSEGAVKAGGFYKFGKLTLSGQLESSEDIDGSDYWMIGTAYSVSEAGTIKFTAGEADGARESSSFALLYDHKLGGKTNVYAGIGSRNDDVGADDDIVTFGVRYRY